MKEWIYKALWVDSQRLGRYSKRYAIVSFVFGVIVVVSGIALDVNLAEKVDRSTGYVNSLSSELSTISVKDVNEKSTLDATSVMLHACSKFVDEGRSVYWTAWFVISFLIFFHALLYYRIHEILKERS